MDCLDGHTIFLSTVSCPCNRMAARRLYPTGSGLALGLALARGILAKSKPADTGSTCLLRLACFLFLAPCCHMNEAGQPSELHDPITLFSPADPQATAGHEPRLGQQKRLTESLRNAPGSQTPCPSPRSKRSPGVQHVDSGFWQSDLAAK